MIQFYQVMKSLHIMLMTLVRCVKLLPFIVYLQYRLLATSGAQEVKIIVRLDQAMPCSLLSSLSTLHRTDGAPNTSSGF